LAAPEFGFENMDGFIPWLLSSELKQDQINILASHLTVSETYFWREQQVFAALTDHILPELIRSKKKAEKSIRIWSAGCATGEEPYSLAIALQKTVPEITDWNITILATDINPKALDKAAAGIYGPWSFRTTPDWLKTRYFHRHEDRKYEIIPEIKNMVTFSCLSLTEDDTYSFIGKNKMDIIFCRNVLMYFTEEWIKRISQNLFHSLSEDGWFVVSSSELSSQTFPQYKTVNFPGAVLYRKGKNGATHSLPSRVPVKEEVQLINTSPIHPFSFSPFLPLNPSPPSTFTRHSPGEGGPSPLQQPHPVPEETSATKIFAIRLLANQGYLSEALSLCNEAIESGKLVSGLYFMRASILQEMDKSSEAIASLKQAIYIDPDYIMGHFTLGNLFIGQGNAKNAKRYFNNVLNLLSRHADDDILPESEGLSVKYIR
jgi:chemotaxis protein methyltransferase CheR